MLSTGRVLQGAPVEEFEGSLRTITGRRHAVAVGSCTDGIAFALSALGIGPGDEVLVTSFSFLASASPILRVGAVPRFVDIDPRTFMMDIGALRTVDRQVDEGDSWSSPVWSIAAYGRSRGHCGATRSCAYRRCGASDRHALPGRSAGSMGAISCLSFDPTKVVGSFSSAGAVVTDDPDLARKLSSSDITVETPQTREYEALGYNSQLSSEMAAMLGVQAIENGRVGIAAGTHCEDLPTKALPTWHRFNFLRWLRVAPTIGTSS